MALRTVQQLKLIVAGVLTGLNLNNVTNLDTALSRAARRVASKVDAPEATGREPITLYSGVYYYLAPEAIFGTSVNLIRRQGDAGGINQYSTKVPIDVFTRGKYYLPNGYTLDLEYNKGLGIIGISSNIPLQKLDITPMSDATLFTAGGSAGTLSTDTVNFYQNPASIRFTATGSSTATVTTTLTNPVDLTDYQGVGVAFLALYVPATGLTSAGIRLGSDSSNYYAITATQGFLGAFQVGDFQLIALDLAAATTTGSPVITAIDYVQVRLAHTATLTNMRIGGLWVSMPSLNEVIYQTASIFKDSTTGELSQEITNDNNLIILNDAAFTILEYECAKETALQQAGGQYTDQIKGFDDILLGNNAQEGLYQRYTANNPSNALRQTGSYYINRRRH